MIKCESCRALYHFFHNEFNKFNNTGKQNAQKDIYSTTKETHRSLFGAILVKNKEEMKIYVLRYS